MTAAPYNDTLEPYHQSNHGYNLWKSYIMHV